VERSKGSGPLPRGPAAHVKGEVLIKPGILSKIHGMRKVMALGRFLRLTAASLH
jgi:hypothetical protein